MRSPLKLWPVGFTSRVILVLVLAIAAQFVVTSLLIGHDERNIQEEDVGRRIAEQLLVAERILRGTDPEQRADIAAALSTRHLDFAQADRLPAWRGGEKNDAVDDVRSAILRWEPALRERRLELVANREEGLIGRYDLAGALEIEPGQWLVFETHDPVWDFGTILLSVSRMAVAAIVIFATAGLLVRTLNRPLQRLSEGARLIGTDGVITFDENGPSELRRVSRALNEMQERIDTLITQRTRALAAVGHDLRTPLARLRLRMDALADPADREAARRDCAAMERMLQDLLVFYDTGEIGFASRSDLASLCQTVADDQVDMGADVTYCGPERLIAQVHNDELARGVCNLVDNAVRYAGSATIELHDTPDRIEIAVCDQGPGIPESEIERLRQPFERLEASRCREHGGIGLGLSIAERAAELHGGQLLIAPNTPRGLRATIVLPGSVRRPV